MNKQDCALETWGKESYAYNMGCIWLGMISITAASLVAALMYFNPKLMQHPGKLIFMMCICEAINVWATLMQVLNVRKIVCWFDLDS